MNTLKLKNSQTMTTMRAIMISLLLMLSIPVTNAQTANGRQPRSLGGVGSFAPVTLSGSNSETEVEESDVLSSGDVNVGEFSEEAIDHSEENTSTIKGEDAEEEDEEETGDEEEYVGNTDYKPHCPHEFSIWGAGGFSTLLYDPSFGEQSWGFGGAFGLGYTYFFNEHWGILFGVEFERFNSSYKFKTDLNNVTYDIPDVDGVRRIDYYADIKHYSEKQKLWNLNIPILLQYQTPLSGGPHQFFANFGFKLGVPIYGRYQNNIDLQTYAYYYDFNWHYMYDDEDLGYYRSLQRSDTEKSKFDLSYMGAAELGVKWKLNKRMSLYTGAYADYAFNDISKTHKDNFTDIDNAAPNHFTVNSVLNSRYTRNDDASHTAKTFTDKVNLFALGLKVRLGISLCPLPDDEKAKEEESKPVLLPTDKEPEEELVPAERKTLAPVEEEAAPVEHKSLEAAPEQPKEPVQEEPAPTRRARTMLEQAEDAEYKRATAEYGKLKDLLILYVDGYEVNQSKLSPKMESLLDVKIAELQKYNSSEYEIICEGHTCDLGREEFNMKLAQMRAEVIREYLMKKGFNGNNLVATSKGESTPIVPNTSEANRKLNRRVVFLIKEK